MSSEASTSGVKVDIHVGSYGIITMQKEPVNSLNLKMWAQLEQALDSLEANPAILAVIFASGLQRDVFSAGNDLLELYAPKTTFERYQGFWVQQNRFLVKLYRSRLATIAAIRGASPAGGCIISLCCDYRLMTPNGHIGLNEVLLGIPVPKFWGLLMARIIGGQAADKILLTGKVASPQEAKALGMVDEIVDKEALLPAAHKLAVKLVKLPGAAHAATKLNLRGEFCTQWEAFYPTEPLFGWKFLTQEDTLKTLGGAMQRLSKNSASKL